MLIISFSLASVELTKLEHLALGTFSLGHLWCTTDDFWAEEAKSYPVKGDLFQHINGGFSLGAMSSALFNEKDRDLFAWSAILGWELFYYVTVGENPDMWDIAFGLLGYYSYRGMFTVKNNQVFIPVYSIKF